MNAVLNFIQERLKSQRSTISFFLKNNQRYNRSSFYRLMNEPSRITEEDIIYISEALKLNETEVSSFRSIVKGTQSSAINEEQTESITDLIYSTPSFYKNEPSKVEFFSNRYNLSRSIRTYNEIIGDISLNQISEITIQIYNCISQTSMSSIYEFFKELRNRINEKSNVKVHVEQLLSAGKINDISKLSLILKIAHNVMFPDYKLFFDKSLAGGSFMQQCNALENFMIIDFKPSLVKSKDVSDSYLIFRLSNYSAQKDYCLETDDRLVFYYYQSMFENSKAISQPEQRVSSVNAVEINEAISTYKQPYKKLIIKGDPSLDSILPEIWDELLKNVQQSGYIDNLREFRKKIDPENKYIYKSDVEFFQSQIDCLRTRFVNNEYIGAENYYDIRSFQKFVQEGYFSDTGKDIIILSDKMRKKQLLYMLGCIYADKNADEKSRGNKTQNKDIRQQHFYFFNSDNVTSDLFILIWNTEGICIVNTRCIDFLNANFLCTDKNIAGLLYEIINNSSDKKRLSYTDSFNLLWTLYINELKGTENEITTYLKEQGQTKDEIETFLQKQGVKV